MGRAVRVAGRVALVLAFLVVCVLVGYCTGTGEPPSTPGYP